MSGVGGFEFFLIIVIGLIVLGPKRLPQVANQLGSWLGQARRMTRMMKRQLEDEIDLDLNSINNPVDLEKSLGLKEEPATAVKKKDPDVSRPEYVHERRDDDPQPADPLGDDAVDSLADTPEESEPEPKLPDDYSPAHGPDDKGLGVGNIGDDNDSISDDELDPVVATEADDAPDEDVGLADNVADELDEPPKKETA